MQSQGDFEVERSGGVRVTVLGLGGAGSSVVSWIKRHGPFPGKLLAADTDASSLGGVHADRRVVLGQESAATAGVGGDPISGSAAARQSLPDLIRMTNGSNLLFLCAGLGGGAGTGAIEVCSETLRTEGRLLVGVAVLPLPFEESRRENAGRVLRRLRKWCDAVVAVEGEKASARAEGTTIERAFGAADEVVGRFITDLATATTKPSMVDMGYDDLRLVLERKGVASIGVGSAEGEGMVERAVSAAMRGQLLGIRDVTRAKGALVHLSLGDEVTIEQVNRAERFIRGSLPSAARVVWGVKADPRLGRGARATVMVTGVEPTYIQDEQYAFSLGPIRVGRAGQARRN